MTKIPNNKPVYDLEERTFQFAKAVRLFVKIQILLHELYLDAACRAYAPNG